MSDTPETDANVASLTKAPDCFCEADHARRLERQRDAYAATIREFLAIADDFAESRRGQTRFLVLADEIDERHPELAEESD